MTAMMLDLFGKLVPVPTSTDPAMTPRQKRRLCRSPARPKGYAKPPGSGPKGETCKTCANYRVIASRSNKTFRKCELLRAHWTSGPGTDIKASAAACSLWTAKPKEIAK